MEKKEHIQSAVIGFYRNGAGPEEISVEMDISLGLCCSMIRTYAFTTNLTVRPSDAELIKKNANEFEYSRIMRDN